MKRILMCMVMMAFLLTVSATTAFAYAYNTNNGNADNAPGKENAVANCVENYTKQREDGKTSNGHGITNNQWPTNCDHNYQ
jgi:uncharacterized protein (UPF0333 family)